MAWRFRTLAAPEKDWGLIPSSPVAACNCL